LCGLSIIDLYQDKASLFLLGFCAIIEERVHMSSDHTLSAEFPEYKEAIHALKISDKHFKRLFQEYETLVKELHRYSEGAAGISDEHAEELKKKRLKLKDELYKMLQAKAA
jgi:uncharacterized protein